jgi:hypothetical protein
MIATCATLQNWGKKKICFQKKQTKNQKAPTNNLIFV